MPSKRISRKFVPQPSHGRGRRESRPNVFIQPEKTDGNGSRPAASPAVSSNVEASAGAGAVAARRPGRARVATARANIFTRTLDRELRQLVILTVLSVVTVIVLRFILE